MSINLNTVLKIRLILYVAVVTKLNLQLIFSFTVLYSQMKEPLCLVLLRNLDSELFDNTDSLLTNILLFIHPWNLFYQLRDSISHFLYINLLTFAKLIRTGHFSYHFILICYIFYNICNPKVLYKFWHLANA